MGDFQHQFRRPDAGSHTVEGNVSGSRAALLEKKRQAEQEAFEEEKAKRKRVDDRLQRDINSKFQPARIITVEEQSFKAKTVGLVSAEDFMNATKEQQEEAKPDAANAAKPVLPKISKQAKKKKKKQAQKMASLLSFANDEEEDDDEQQQEDGGHEAPIVTTKKKNIAKDPTVDTSFLPDKQREEENQAERLRLEQEWKDRQEEIQKEKLEITYSYWDGSGHRRTCETSKGSSIGDFLEIVRQDLCGDFKDLGSVASDALLYVKEDLILPHDITFYDLIVTKARGKSGPLFHFDVHDDVRVGPLDRRVEKDESHPGKVVERRWYERNKHIFPASRWEVYDPATTYGSYTIHGGVVNKKEKK